MKFEQQQTARLLDSTYTKNDHVVPLRSEQIRYCIKTAASLHEQHPFPAEGGTTPGLWNTVKHATMMTREEALLLLRDYVEDPYHLMPIVHGPHARSMVSNFYDQLEQGHQVDPAYAALILGISATSASFFNVTSSRHHMFTSAEHAAHASATWAQSALNILDEVSHSRTFNKLEQSQAWAIMAYVIFNVEGCSARFRFLHSCSLSVARDMALHLVDSPAAPGNHDDMATKEIKRRVWWHLASTDWLLSLMGGPLDGTYAVQPRHMNVKYPRNLNDNDLASLADETLTYPLNVPTQVSCFLQRIRLAEICRSVVDARAPGLPDVEITDFDRVSALDRLFEQALDDLPPFLQIDDEQPLPPGAPRHLALQRALILLGFHVRRARLHRPFLLHDAQDARYRPSRARCLASARTILSISTGLLDGTTLPIVVVDDQQQTPSSGPGGGGGGGGGSGGGGWAYHRIGLVISGAFMACTVLVLDAAMRSRRDERYRMDARTRADLTRACRALAVAGRQSDVAAGLVRSLTCVLRQYRVQDVDDIGMETVAAPAPDNPEPNKPQPPQQQEPAVVPAAASAAASDAPRSSLDAGEGLLLPSEYIGDFGFDGLWDEILGNAPVMEGYDQLFAGFDSFCGPA
ncbi:hypothetical protein GGR56DRAFT_688212 [Xylariaceae sp. FL0804]|nr:hypothetical protein GGR56DRAFT_688212 [Xylariaceae sp. FL0804]